MDTRLTYPFYSIAIQGNSTGRHPLYLDRVLAVPTSYDSNKTFPKGILVKDPCYNLPAVWLDDDEIVNAGDEGFTIYRPLNVMSNHLSEVIQAHLAELLTREETERLLSQPGIKTLTEELIPSQLSLSQVQRVLQNLLQEKVSIRHVPHILELLLDYSKKVADPNQLTELVRSGLAIPICQKLLAHQKASMS